MTQPEPDDSDIANVADQPGGVRAAIEAILMVTDQPVSSVTIATTLGRPVPEVDQVLRDLTAEYRGTEVSEPRGFELREVGGGWRLFSAPAFADVVAAFVLDGQTARLTQAALETLAIVAYRQPVTRGQVSGVRGVNVDSVVRTLTTRGLVGEVGSDPVSGAVLYGTTPYFLERMGLTSLDQLPPLAPFLPDLEGLDGFDLPPQIATEVAASVNSEEEQQ